jgi:hypothetical protein
LTTLSYRKPLHHDTPHTQIIPPVGAEIKGFWVSVTFPRLAQLQYWNDEWSSLAMCLIDFERRVADIWKLRYG